MGLLWISYIVAFGLVARFVELACTLSQVASIGSTSAATPRISAITKEIDGQCLSEVSGLILAKINEYQVMHFNKLSTPEISDLINKQFRLLQQYINILEGM